MGGKAEGPFLQAISLVLFDLEVLALSEFRGERERARGCDGEARWSGRAGPMARPAGLEFSHEKSAGIWSHAFGFIGPRAQS